jgi:orotate phosphoribosyltransferase
MQKFQKDFIELAVFAGALKFGQFKLKSGRISPYYFNSGVFYTGELSNSLAGIIAEFVTRTLPPEKYDAVFGPAYKGIPLAVSVSMALARKGINKPWCFNRKEAKAHGDMGAFVGAPIKDGMRFIILDDVFTTGGAKEEAISQLLSVAKISVAGVFILLDRQEKDEEGKDAIAAFEDRHNTKVHPIVTADQVFDYLSKNEINGKLLVDEAAFSSYQNYKRQYGV